MNKNKNKVKNMHKNKVKKKSSSNSMYSSFIIGFILNEDSAGGAIADYSFHLGVREFFLNDTLYGLKNYLETGAVHSPIFIVLLKYLLFLSFILTNTFLQINSIFLFCRRTPGNSPVSVNI